eukprot:symbB.v1.2.029062.t1/scaffold3144.1/size62492/2
MECCGDGFLEFCNGRRVKVETEESLEAVRAQDLPLWQYDAMLEMRAQIEPRPVEDKDLLRFLVARKWNVSAAVEQFQAMQKWRQQNNVERYRRNAPGPIGPDAAADAAQDPRLSRQGVEVFPQLRLVEQIPNEGMHIFFGQTLAFGFDKQGHPIQIQNGGLAGWRFPELLRMVGDQKQVLSHLIRFQELQAARMEESSRRFGRPITKQVVITNAGGMPLKPHPQAVSAFKDFLFVSSRFYPESLQVVFVVNAPMVFVALFRLIKTWLDPVTAAKIQVIGSNFQSKLLEHIDADQLPRDYGGTVDIDILGETWTREECERYFNECQRVLRPNEMLEQTSDGENVATKEKSFPMPRYMVVVILFFAFVVLNCI